MKTIKFLSTAAVAAVLTVGLAACDKKAEAPVAPTTTEASAPMVAPGTTATATDGTVVNVAPDTGETATPVDVDVTVGTPATTTTTTETTTTETTTIETK